ncbi:MAG: TetR/AcrR family transcriptional regulator [Polyangiales bacterium]
MLAAETRKDPNDKRQAIMDAALVLFADRGFHGTAVPLVAERAGVGAGTLYRYFESKEALVNALYVHWKAQLTIALLANLPTDVGPRAQFGAVWQRLCRFALDHPKAFVFLELHHHAEYLDERSRAADANVLVPLHGFVEGAIRQQVLKEIDPAILMSIVWGALVGIIRAVEAGHVARTADLDRQLLLVEVALWEAIRR